MREVFREPADLEFRNAQHLRHVAHRAPGLIRGKTAHNGGPFGTILLENQINDVVLPVMGEINVNIRQLVERHAVLVQKAAKIKLEADRANTADAEAVADQRVGGAAAGDPLDARAAAFLQNLPYHQKIFFVTNLGNDAEFLFNLTAKLRGPLPVTPLQTLQNQFPQKSGGRGAVQCVWG